MSQIQISNIAEYAVEVFVAAIDETAEPFPPLLVDLGFVEVEIIETAVRGMIGQTGVQGVQGIQGIPGVDGALGSDLRYTHTQNTPSAIWTVIHNLGKHPSADAVDSAGTKVYGSLQYDSLNQFTYTFSVPMSGQVFCN